MDILSETKYHTRVQPHLKKCFMSIAKLQFMEDQKVTVMVSGEKEVVPFSTIIVPAEAKVDHTQEVAVASHALTILGYGGEMAPPRSVGGEM